MASGQNYLFDVTTRDSDTRSSFGCVLCLTIILLMFYNLDWLTRQFHLCRFGSLNHSSSFTDALIRISLSRPTLERVRATDFTFRLFFFFINEWLPPFCLRLFFYELIYAKRGILGWAIQASRKNQSRLFFREHVQFRFGKVPGLKSC